MTESRPYIPYMILKFKKQTNKENYIHFWNNWSKKGDREPDSPRK